MYKKDVYFDVLRDSEESSDGSVFEVTYFGEINFGGGGPYEGWHDTLNSDQTKELYEALRVFYE